MQPSQLPRVESSHHLQDQYPKKTGMSITDVFIDYATWYFYWNDHDSGAGFLTLDEAMKSLRIKRK